MKYEQANQPLHCAHFSPLHFPPPSSRIGDALANDKIDVHQSLKVLRPGY